MELPEGCIAAILSRTTPADAASLAVVSKTFRSAADSDTVWDRFLPSDYHSIVSQSPSLAGAPSKKALYLALSDHPIIINNGKKSFQLEKKSGNKCYMLAARALSIAWGDDERYWHWITSPESRFPEVAELQGVWWFGIDGMINTISLSPNTHYGAFLVFKFIDDNAVNYDFPVKVSVSVVGGDSSTKNVCLGPNVGHRSLRNYRVEGLQRPTVRNDGWLEIEMGEFFNSGLEDEEVQMSVLETGNWKDGLRLEGIEVRPNFLRKSIEQPKLGLLHTLKSVWSKIV